MTAGDVPSPSAVERLAQAPLAPLVAVLAQRFGASDRPVRSVRVTVDDAGRHALADLLGSARVPPATSTVTTAKLAAALGVDDGDGLRAVVEAVAGPLDNRSAARVTAQQELARAVETVTAAAAGLGPRVVEWAATAARTLPGPVAGRVDDIAGVIDVVAEGRDVPVPVPVVAVAAFADPHALDADTRRGALLANCAALASGQRVPGNSAQRRAALAAVGLVADEVSSTVASWGVVPPPDHPLHGAARMCTEAGEPFVWTLSMLQRWPVTVDRRRVLVVENPAVLTVAAGNRFDSPVVSTAGVPSVAVTTLLDQLLGAGALVDVHADFDTAGLGIVADLVANGRARPWHMTADDYTSALDRAGARRDERPVPATSWDPDLAAVFETHRRVVFEEQVLDHVLT